MLVNINFEDNPCSSICVNINYKQNPYCVFTKSYSHSIRLLDMFLGMAMGSELEGSVPILMGKTRVDWGWGQVFPDRQSRVQGRG